ncbi:MAG TPA: DUF4359 domain-containing protein [Prochlorococcus sp.]|jgi:hypothetical protein|nr:DUF4359 domain-containing protein [Prochlorococcaceae cyanobacterium ETNP18_MAG_17]MDP6321391.1 DUF4359 domain-containing protein [Prochlorococcaceae cyanobacterium ETNP14_MAG_5]HJL68355.1 DUF4359 domain-containing protein [Prochlorococcaceae cyanobacterium Gl_MAG_24]|tara:strand:- start:941 stop:1318 length:378 start_codon:yes stop_codon:yes gene_type:complete
MAIAGCGALLVWTNPSMEDYSEYAGEQLVEIVTEEVCERQGMPMVLRLWIRNCPELIAAQKQTLASIAGQFTTRRNLGLGSIYTTKFDGQDFLPKMHLPSYTVTTLAGAGQFLTIKARINPSDQE